MRERRDRRICGKCQKRSVHYSPFGHSLYCDTCLYEMTGKAASDCLEHSLEEPVKP